jgi:hypothetical protein
LILMQISGIDQQFEERLVELFVIEFADNCGVLISDGIVNGTLTRRQFVNRNERRAKRGGRYDLRFLCLRFFSSKA